MNLTLLQDVVNIKPMLGPTGTLLYTFVLLALAVLNLYQHSRSKSAEKWESAAKAADHEKAAHRERADRLQAENQTLAEEVGRLRAMTDLSSLSKDNREEHTAIVDALKGMDARASERHAETLRVMQENTRALLGFQSQMAGVFESMTGNLRAIEQRMKG